MQLPPADYPRVLAETFGPNADAVAASYPLDRYGGSAPLAYSAAVTDGEFACVDDAHRQRPRRATRRSTPTSSTTAAAPAPDPLRTLPFPVGASHSLELRYLFDVGGAPPLTPRSRCCRTR